MSRSRYAPAALAVLLGGCIAEPSGAPDASVVVPGSPADGGGGPVNDALDGSVLASFDAAPPALPASGKAKVRFKRVAKIRADLAAALSIAPAELCKEVGAYDCFEVHGVTLGGVEPYELGIFEPLEDTTVTTPIAVDRIALAACRERARADLSGAGAIIFRELPIDAGGALTSVETDAVRLAIVRLYQRLLLRDPASSEIEHLRGLYGEVVAAGSTAPARDWAILSCFAVATSLESLFY